MRAAAREDRERADLSMVIIRFSADMMGTVVNY
jgi:hypothetical protein